MKQLKPLIRTLFIPGMFFLGACCCNKSVVVAPQHKHLTHPEVIHPSLGDVYFDFDKSDLRSDAVAQLKTNARWLEEHAGRKVVIEGHCDERGTNEYNLALGERRASSAKDFIVHLGVEPAKLKTISYGEEKPFADGHNEEAWAQNRRAHFIAE